MKEAEKEDDPRFDEYCSWLKSHDKRLKIIDMKFVEIQSTLKLARMMAKAVEGGNLDDIGGGRVINKYKKPGYHGYAELLFQKSTDAIIDKIIKRLKLTDKSSPK